MCSINEDIIENGMQNLMSIEEKDIKSFSKCNKCKIAIPSVILRNKDAYCRNCFLFSTTHKFKAELGKSKLIKYQDRVLVYHKIGHPSTSLLHFLRSGLNLDTPKKLRFEPVILFIEDQYQLNLEERKAMVQNVNNEILSFGFVGYFISLAKYVLNPDKISKLIVQSEMTIEEDHSNQMFETLGQNATIKKELISLYRRQLLLDSAKFLNCKFIFTPEICVDIASNLLSNLSLGRYQVSNDTGFCDDRHEDIKILRPLRQFDIKELAYYNLFNNLSPLAVTEIKEENPFSSVQELTSKFIRELQTNFPATISTVMRTGDKLVIDKNNLVKCDLCKVNYELENNELTADEAIKISILYSQAREQDISKKSLETSENNYCYACMNLQNNLKM